MRRLGIDHPRFPIIRETCCDCMVYLLNATSQSALSYRSIGRIVFVRSVPSCLLRLSLELSQVPLTSNNRRQKIPGPAKAGTSSPSHEDGSFVVIRDVRRASALS